MKIVLELEETGISVKIKQLIHGQFANYGVFQNALPTSPVSFITTLNMNELDVTCYNPFSNQPPGIA